MITLKLSSSLLSRLAAAALLTASLGATAQTVPLAHDAHAYAYQSPMGAQAREAGVVASHDVHIAGADWLRLQLADVKLPQGAKLRFTSLQDGAQQHLDAKTIVHPAPKDQYVPTTTRQFTNGGVGNDWGVFTVFANSETGLMPLEAQGSKLKMAKDVPLVGAQVEIHGYGVDSGVDNQTQQLSLGPIASVNEGTTTLRYKADTEGGNSGSAVLSGGRVVAIHTHGGCTTGGDGGSGNQGTLFTHKAFKKAFKQICSS